MTMTETREELETKSVLELQDLARERGISGFSDMRHAELVDALTGTAQGDGRPAADRRTPGLGEPGSASGDGGAAEVQQRMDEEQAKGYSGTVPDPTPNHAYTVAGNDEPTPETDPELGAEARKAAGLR